MNNDDEPESERFTTAHYYSNAGTLLKIARYAKRQMKSILSQFEVKRRRQDVSDSFSFDGEVENHVQKFWRDRSPLVLRAQDLLRVEEKLACYLNDSKVLIGVAPC